MRVQALSVVVTFGASFILASTPAWAQAKAAVESRDGGQTKGRDRDKKPATRVKVVNTPLAVVASTPLPVVLPTPVPVTGTFTTAGTPAQLVLQGLFADGSINLEETILGPISYTLPEGFSRLLIRHVSCRAVVPSGRKVQIFLMADLAFPSIAGPESLVELIPDDEIFIGAIGQPRQVAHASVYAFLGVATPGGPVTGNTLTLAAQRDTTSGTGGVTCVIGGELFE
jgi:hypothetical protein